MPKEKIVIGIGGKVGTGKTTVGKIFHSFGAHYISADEIGWEVLPEIAEGLKKRFGKMIMAGDKIAKEKLREIVFSDIKNLGFLNSLSHPRLIKKILARIKKIKSGVMVIDAALLFDWDEIYKRVDYPILVVADERVMTQRARVKGINKKTFQRIISMQKSVPEMARRAKFIIKNSGTLLFLTRKCQKIYKRIEDDC